MTKPSPIRILIADDHPIVREGLAALINRRSDMRVVSEAAGGRQAVLQYFAHLPDVALVDLWMPDLDGMGAIKAICKKAPDARILILSTYDGDEDIYRSLQAGAKAYLLKDCPREQLLESIRAVHAGRMVMPPDIQARLASRLNTPALTTRETEVLRLMALGKDNSEIGRNLCITEGTVKTHVNRIFKKLGTNTRAEAVSRAFRSGIVHVSELRPGAGAASHPSLSLMRFPLDSHSPATNSR